MILLKILLCTIILTTQCSHIVNEAAENNEKYEKDLLLESSGPKPAWIYNVPSEEGYTYFVGTFRHYKFDKALKGAKLNVIEDYSIYLGADVKTLLRAHQEDIKNIKNDIHTSKGKVISDIEALLIFYSSGIQFVSRYWERRLYKDIGYEYYRYYILGKVKNEFVENERENIKRVMKAIKY